MSGFQFQSYILFVNSGVWGAESAVCITDECKLALILTCWNCGFIIARGLISVCNKVLCLNLISVNSFFLTFPVLVQNAGLSTSDQIFPLDITATVERWRIQHWTLGWFHILVAKYVREISSLPVDTSACYFVTQVWNTW